jgi:penicillin-binding protein 2
MEPYSGQIIALANYPNFNPSVFIRKSGSVISRLFNDPDAPFVNRAISGLYPAGSLFKLIVASAALQLDKLKDSKTFFCPGSINIGKQEFACWDTHNQQNLFGAIVHSCNVFFYRTGLLLGPNFLHEYALKFGLSKPTAIDLPYEKSGFVPSVIWRRVYRLQNWFEGDTANLSIGQGELLVTPLQMLRMIAVFANGGTLVNPYIVKDIDGRDISHYQRKNTDLSLKKSVVNYIRQALRSVVSEPTGTANILSGLSVSVAGKTGTAQVPRGQPHGWFVGFFPYEKPEFAICVFLENGVAGYNACVVAKNIIETMVKERLIAEQR